MTLNLSSIPSTEWNIWSVILDWISHVLWSVWSVWSVLKLAFYTRCVCMLARVRVSHAHMCKLPFCFYSIRSIRSTVLCGFCVVFRVTSNTKHCRTMTYIAKKRVFLTKTMGPSDLPGVYRGFTFER